MKIKHAMFLLLLQIPGTFCISQSTIYCVGRKEFVINPLLRYAGLSLSIVATFSVRNFRPVDVRLRQLDMDSTSWLQFPETIDNLNRIVFLKDTTHTSLLFRYQCMPARDLSRDYVHINSDSVLDIVFRRADSIRLGHEVLIKIVPQTGDSVIWVSTLFGTPTINQPAVIEVERIFGEDVDSCVILSNNHPELTEQILTEARRFDWNWFRYLQNPDQSVPDRKEKVPFVKSKRRYFVRFNVVREIPECNYQQSF